MCKIFILITLFIHFWRPNLVKTLVITLILLNYFSLSCCRVYFSTISTLVCISIFLCLCMRECLTIVPKQQRLDFAFVIITREEREVEIEKEFSALNQRWEREQSRPIKEIFKWPVDRPKQTETTLLKPKVEKMKVSMGTKKVRGSYTNWFGHVL